MIGHQWFTNPQFARIVVDQWKHYERAYEFHLNTFSVMPDHYHVVLNVGQQKTISQILHAINSYTVTLVSQQLEQTLKPKIWEGNPWDEVIRSEEMYWQKVAYTLFNPWGEGLVSDPLSPIHFQTSLIGLIEKGRSSCWICSPATNAGLSNPSGVEARPAVQ